MQWFIAICTLKYVAFLLESLVRLGVIQMEESDYAVPNLDIHV
jgi:hypothetical protein